jgi:hypothetical protein
VTPNDDAKQDAYAGPNYLQNFPRLIWAFAQGNSTAVRIKFVGALSEDFKFDFYVNDQVDPSGNGEGKT